MALVPDHIEQLQPYRPGKPIEDVKREFGLDRVVKLASNENPLGVSPQAIQAMIASIHQINRYPDIASMVLRTKLARRFDVKIDNVITGHGSEAIMSVIMRTFLFDDDEVITSEGTFVGFYVIANARPIKMDLVPLKDYRFDLPGILERITPKTKIIYLVNPNNPTGTIFGKDEFENFISQVPDHILIMLDEAYYEFVSGNPDYPDSMAYRRDNIITLRTFSKAYGLAGTRIGYGFAHETLINHLLKVRLPFEPGIPSQMAGVAALNDSQFLDYYLKMNDKGKHYYYDIFDGLGIKYVESDTNFVMCDFETEERVNSISGQLLRKGVIVRPLRAFGLPHCIRVTVGIPDENEIFAKALKDVI